MFPTEVVHEGFEIQVPELREQFVLCSRKFPEVDRLFGSGLEPITALYAGMISEALRSSSRSLAAVESIRGRLVSQTGGGEQSGPGGSKQRLCLPLSADDLPASLQPGGLRIFVRTRGHIGSLHDDRAYPGREPFAQEPCGPFATTRHRGCIHQRSGKASLKVSRGRDAQGQP